MHDPASIAAIVGSYSCLVGVGWGMLVDPLRRSTLWMSVASVILTALVVGALAPDAAPTIPLLVLSFRITIAVRERRGRTRLTPREHPPRTPPPPPGSASATG